MASKAMAPSPAQDDFSFPKITNPSPCYFIESPPLWRTTSVASSRLEHPGSDHDALSMKGEKDHEENLDISPLISRAANHINQRKSFSYIEGAAAMKRMIEEDESQDDEEVEEEEEEKMDMLWENFNEESNQVTMGCGRVLKDRKKCTSPGRVVEFKCVQALNLSKATKRPSLVVLIKVLKKVFLLRTSPTSFKKTKL